MVQKATSQILLAILILSHTGHSRRRNWRLGEGLMKFIREGTRHFREEPQDTEAVLPEYDFFIVGAGSAGSVVANRLTANSDWNVLLIEAGHSENFVMDVPIMATLFQFSDANWKYKMEPSNKVCLGMRNRQCSCPRGRVVGGTSVINFMIYTRGHRRDYDHWEELGNSGWGYRNMLPYFMEIENMTISELAKDTRYHSTRGEVAISYAPYRTRLADAFVEAGRELGHMTVDYNGETQTGFSYLQTTTMNGTRWNANRAFLHPIRNRKNFHLMKRSQVTKILIDPSTKTAYGVEFVQDKKKYVVRARREVILSAGAVNSPQLLMLSGVGPKQHLTDLNIPVIQDLSVGFNLMDHPGLIGLTFVVNQSVGLILDEIVNDGSSLAEYLNYHKGPISVPAGCEAIALIDTENPRSVDGDPDLEILFFGASLASDNTFHKSIGVSEDIYKAVYEPIEDTHAWSAVPLTLKPKSRGRIKLKSSDPFKNPLIYYDIFEDPQDLELQLLGVKKIMELSNTEAFKKYGSTLLDYPIPGCKHLEFGSDDYWRCVIRHLAIGIWHLSGTCKMGPSSDPSAVVDERLRVYGIKRLRVIDASIMPVVPTAHTNFPSMAIGAKGADMVIQDWKSGRLKI
jgi:choline dehydrogenase